MHRTTPEQLVESGRPGSFSKHAPNTDRVQWAQSEAEDLEKELRGLASGAEGQHKKDMIGVAKRIGVVASVLDQVSCYE